MVKHALQFALFAAFSLWLLYQISQPNNNSEPGNQLSNERMSNFLGRKGSAGLSKSTLNANSGLTLEDVTNPGEEGEIPQYSKEIEAVEFRSKTESLKEGNDNNTLPFGHDSQTKSNEGGSLTITKSEVSFPDENGIPQHVRDKFIGIQTNKPLNKTRVEKLIATRVGSESNETVGAS